MTAREALLARCTFTDRDCVDDVVLKTRHPLANHETTPPWPLEGHGCDFCGTWASTITRCGACNRWLGLADCECADPAVERRAGGVEIQTSAAKRADVRCKWCALRDSDAAKDDQSESIAALTTAPESNPSSEGLLRRVVFVIEPLQENTWRWHTAQRLLVPLLEIARPGTVLVYGIECDESEESWCDAFALVRRFAEQPHAHLPPDCRRGDTPVHIDIVLGTHSIDATWRSSDVWLEHGNGVANSLSWWCTALAKHALAVPARRNKQRFAISTLYWISCNMFDERVASSSQRLLRTLADDHAINVMASDGRPVAFQQIALVASHIIASVHAPQPAILPASMRRFQPNSPTLLVEPYDMPTTLSSLHPNDIKALVVKLCGSNNDDDENNKLQTKKRQRVTTSVESNNCYNERANATQRRALLAANVDEARDALLALWPKQPLRATVDTYARLFDAAAAVRALVAHNVLQSTTVDWIEAKLTSGRWSVKVSRPTLERNVSFLAARLARKGMLDENPARGDAWSLERAIRQRLVPPPLIRFLRSEMSMRHFDAALDQLRAVWRRRAAPRPPRLRPIKNKKNN